MKNNDLLYLSDLNLAESVREITRWHSGGHVIEHDDLLITKGADLTPVTNFTIRTAPEAKPPADKVMEMIRDYYYECNSGFSIYVRSHIDSDLETTCQSANVIKIYDNPGMMIDKVIPEKPMPEDVEIRPVKDISGAEDFARVAIDSFQSLGMRPETGDKIFAAPERMLKPYNYLVVGYVRGVPSSCAMVIFSHSIAGVYWVGTAQNARRIGLAEASTRAVTNEALNKGARVVVLQASRFGEPIYRRMGFNEFTRYLWYMYFHKKI
ncbi:MAG: hypothetical protein A2176_08575 [Spirochaetes bacterium RBG_13_51_14]|nr:MAG: hypothetical protein A2176_08575 [Spirochaetes bacterium RBG_13_51_14]